MSFWAKPKKKRNKTATPAESAKRPEKGNRFALEVKLLAPRAREAGMNRYIIPDVFFCPYG